MNDKLLRVRSPPTESAYLLRISARVVRRSSATGRQEKFLSARSAAGARGLCITDRAAESIPDVVATGNGSRWDSYGASAVQFRAVIRYTQ